ncbi:hypothetical protein BKE38_03805 [Pseudoroseomonas deserti]|uniref:Uncharacterized protein n=1 Tax=Teichococcus deserti TaxID=1817963 RepID=A0A1V2H6M0_9PROT|nr:hypothetical protein [Pseudoroseomonas deserti]ONG57902.1 hypothetical protein BKE38_03805 [Pseudoroseomonas deserti]
MTTRRILFRLAAASFLATPFAAAAQERLGLAERRAIAAYRKDSYPAIEQGIQQAAGFPVRGM